MKILIIEDELINANRLKKILAEVEPSSEVLNVCSSIENSVKWLKANSRPDLILMDVELADGESFEIFNQVNVNSPVIFVTAYSEFAIKAFKFSAIDYLLKPVNKEELKQALEKVKKHTKANAPTVNMELFSTLLSSIKNNTQPRKIAISNLDGITYLDVEKIIRFSADSNYTQIFAIEGKKFMASKTLKDFDELLQGSRFFRSHNTHLINLDHVEKYVKGEGGYVIMSDGSSVEVSRAKKLDLLNLLSL